MYRLCRLFALLIMPTLLCGCVSSSLLQMSREKPPLDQSVVSPKIKERKLSKIMVIPPAGTPRGAFDPIIVLFEREFLKHEATVISGAITGKVVLESPGSPDEKKSEAAALLSDLERALIMARRTGAEAILQVGEFKWSPDAKEARFFIVDDPGTPFREVTRAQYGAFTGHKLSFAGPELHFVGRFVDVENGEIVATLDVTMPVNFFLPTDYIATYGYDPLRFKWNDLPKRESFVYTKHTFYADPLTRGRRDKTELPWVESAQKPAEARLIEYVVQRLSAR